MHAATIQSHPLCHLRRMFRSGSSIAPLPLGPTFIRMLPPLAVADASKRMKCEAGLCEWSFSLYRTRECPGGIGVSVLPVGGWLFGRHTCVLFPRKPDSHATILPHTAVCLLRGFHIPSHCPVRPDAPNRKHVNNKSRTGCHISWLPVPILPWGLFPFYGYASLGNMAKPSWCLAVMMK